LQDIGGLHTFKDYAELKLGEICEGVAKLSDVALRKLEDVRLEPVL
jgi:hypothetical protein